MRIHATAWTGILLAALVIGTAGAQPRTLAVIVHPTNPVESLEDYQLEAIFTSRRNHWTGGDNIAVFHYESHSPLRVAFDRAVLRMSPSEVSRFWIAQRIRGRKGPPRAVPNASLMARVIERLEPAIGYVPMDVAERSDVKIVARIEEGKVLPP